MLQSTITPGAVDLLISAVGNDLPQLAAELDKLASYASGSEIDEDAVGAVVGVRRGETLGDLLDRVLAHDAPGALALVDHVLAQRVPSAKYLPSGDGSTDETAASLAGSGTPIVATIEPASLRSV